MPAIGDGPSDYFCDRFRAWILQVREPSGLCCPHLLLLLMTAETAPALSTDHWQLPSRASGRYYCRGLAEVGAVSLYFFIGHSSE